MIKGKANQQLNNCNTFFFPVFLIRGCKVDVQQSIKVMSRKDQQSVSIPCSCNISNCSGNELDKLKISWYVFHKDIHYQIDLKNQPTKYTLEGHNLKINSLSINDFGVYYCAAALSNVAHRGAQAIGQGITLKVTGEKLKNQFFENYSICMCSLFLKMWFASSEGS